MKKKTRELEIGKKKWDEGSREDRH